MMNDKINEFLKADRERMAVLVEQYPENIPVSKAAEFLSADDASIRAAIENDCFGLSWRKAGSLRHGYLIPTAQFVRWYLLFKLA